MNMVVATSNSKGRAYVLLPCRSSHGGESSTCQVAKHNASVLTEARRCAAISSLVWSVLYLDPHFFSDMSPKELRSYQVAI